MTIDAFLTDDHRVFKSTVEKVIEKECPREYVRKCDQEKIFPYEFYSKFPELGWYGLSIPEEYGGSDVDRIYYSILQEALGKYSFDIGAGYGLTMWGASSICNNGSEEQKKYYLPKMISGEIRFSFSLTEPDAGSDAAAISVFAEIDGDDFIINGQKVFSTAAQAKNNIIIMAVRTDKTVAKHKGISFIMVPNNTPGLELLRLDTLSRRILGTNEIFLTDVRVPRKNLIGNVNGGWEMLVSQLEIERIGVAASYVGNAQTAVSDALRYAKERVQFGRAIGEFQVIKHMLADMQTYVDASRLMVYRVAWMASKGKPCATEASMAKLFSSEAFQMVATKGMQILGGYAQMPEYDMERYFRDARQSSVGGGTSEIQRPIIARGLGL